MAHAGDVEEGVAGAFPRAGGGAGPVGVVDEEEGDGAPGAVTDVVDEGEEGADFGEGVGFGHAWAGERADDDEVAGVVGDDLGDPVAVVEG